MKNFMKKHRICLSILAVLFAFVLFLFSSLSPLPSTLWHIPGLPFTHKQYLVIFQNDAELRPTGGFITSYAILNFDHGFPTKFELSDVYFGIDQHEYVKPPYPLEELLGYEFYKGHTFRDANFDPDFPKTVKSLLSFYEMTKPATFFDGVFAVNYSILEDALAVLGEIEVSGMTLSHNNVFESLEHYVSNIDRHNVDQIKGRKGILKELAKELVKKAALSPFKYRDLAELTRREMEAKNILVWFKNFESPYDGSYPKEWKGDFISFNSANYGGMKTDRYIKRDVRYFLTIDRDDVNGGYVLNGNLEIEMLHTGGTNIPLSGDYSGYERIYLPKGTELIENNENYSFEENSEYLVIGEIVKLKPGESIKLNYKYKLPQTVFDGENYKIHLQKQSGVSDHYAVYIRTPAGTSVASDTFKSRENTAFYNGALTKDLDLSFSIIPDAFPPRLVFQDFLNPDTIVMHFNEDLPSSCATDPLNYKVTDLNKKRPEIDQKINITAVTHQGSGVFIDFAEPIDQEDEHFSVELRNIFDMNGNFVEPNPKLITIVQNFIH